MNPISLLRQHKDYAWLFLSETINAIGAMFTSVLIYHTFESQQASDWWFTLVYLGMFVPSYLGTILAKRVGQYFHLGKAMIIANILCLISLTVTIYGYMSQSFILMLASEVGLSLMGGFVAPFFAFYHHHRFKKEVAITAVVKLDMIQFGVVSVIGFALGTWLITVVSASWFFGIDALTFFISLAIIYWLMRRKARLLTVLPTFSHPRSLKKLSRTAQNVFWLTPMLAVIGIPIMSIGPIFSQHLEQPKWMQSLGVSSVLMFLLCRALGQFIGPAIADKINLEKLTQAHWLMPMCLANFIGCYTLIAVTSSLSLMLVIVIIAHVFSNLVSMTASYALLTKFDDVESISVKQNQYATMLGFCSALLTTGLLNTIGTSAVFTYLVIVWSISTVLYLRR